MGYRGYQGVTRNTSGLQGITGGYRRLQEVTECDKGLQWCTRGYKGLQQKLSNYSNLAQEKLISFNRISRRLVFTIKMKNVSNP